MKAWRIEVFNRDNFTCQLCEARSKAGNPVVLNSHHIIRFIDNEELRFKLSNGITLCEKCHNLTKGKEKEYQSLFLKTLKLKE